MAELCCSLSFSKLFKFALTSGAIVSETYNPSAPTYLPPKNHRKKKGFKYVIVGNEMKHRQKSNKNLNAKYENYNAYPLNNYMLRSLSHYMFQLHVYNSSSVHFLFITKWQLEIQGHNPIPSPHSTELFY